MGVFNISGQTHALPAEAEKAKNQNVFAGARLPPFLRAVRQSDQEPLIQALSQTKMD